MGRSTRTKIPVFGRQTSKKVDKAKKQDESMRKKRMENYDNKA